MTWLATERRTPVGTALLVALLMTGLPVACASGDADGTGDIGHELPRMIEPLKSGGSLVGNYLAGRHAQSQREMGKAADFVLSAIKKDPRNTDLLHRGFVLLAAEGRMGEAMGLAKRLLAEGKQDDFATLLLAVDEIKQRAWEAAAKRLAALSDNGIGLLMSPLLRAWATQGAGRTDEALKLLSALAKDEKLATIHDLHAALINDLAGRSQAAEKLYLDTIGKQEDPTYRLAQLLGNLYERTGRGEEAAKLYQRYIKANPDTQLLEPLPAPARNGAKPALLVGTAEAGAAEALFGVSSSMVRREGRDTALVLGRMALHLKPDFAVMQVLLADILEADDRLAEANAIYAAVDRRSPLSWTARLHAAVNLDRLDRSDEALQQLRLLADERKTDSQPLIEMGDIHRRRERFPEAVKAYDEAVARVGTLDARHWSLLYSRGMALERSQQWKLAEKDFLKALEFEPDQPYVLNYLGYSWVELGQHLDEAQDMIRKAVKGRPTDGYIVDSLGWVYFRLGKYDDAARELERAVELKPEDPVINDHLGDAYWKVDRKDEARFQWKRALSLNPEEKLIPAIQKKIEKGMDEKAGEGGNG